MELSRLSARAARVVAAMLVLGAVTAASSSAAVAGSSAAGSPGFSAPGSLGFRAPGSLTGRPDPNTPVLVTSPDRPPTGYRLTAATVQRTASRVASVRAVVRRHRGSYSAAYTKGPGRWQVSWFTLKGTEIAQVYVADATGRVTEAWTGFQVAWSMARGYPGAFGRRVNAWYAWLPMCVLFLAPFIPWRRRPALLHLDLLMLLGFSISLAFFNHGRIGVSVPLAYPFLGYLFVRMLALARGRGLAREPLRLLVPVSWLTVAVVFLVGFRVGLNLINSNVIDVGYAGVIGADRLEHGKPLYGGFPRDNANGDTYGPVNYYLYVPARAVFGWSGSWDDLPAAHAAAIAFDLLTLLGLFLLGRRIRGPTLGVVLAYAWVSYPFTLYALSSNSNDSLVSLLVVLALLALSSAPARGLLAALAGLTKFAPLALAPLFLRGAGERAAKRSVAAYALAYALTAGVVMLPVVAGGDLRSFWHDTIAYQAGRGSPFSIWGLWGGLGVVQHLVQGAAAGLAVLAAFFPRGQRSSVQVGALAAAILIALQLGITHWFYLYIVWFFPLVMVALLGRYPERAPGTTTHVPYAELDPAPALLARAAVRT